MLLNCYILIHLKAGQKVKPALSVNSASVQFSLSLSLSLLLSFHRSTFTVLTRFGESLTCRMCMTIQDLLFLFFLSSAFLALFLSFTRWKVISLLLTLTFVSQVVQWACTIWSSTVEMNRNPWKLYQVIMVAGECSFTRNDILFYSSLFFSLSLSLSLSLSFYV